MVVQVDFTVGADNLTWLNEEDLTQIVANKRFQTPDAFYETTLVVFLNGVRVEQSNDDGYNIIDEDVFEMKETYPSHFRVSCGYVKKEI